jgi:glycerol-3-phosphate acyltransferase PlsX
MVLKCHGGAGQADYAHAVRVAADLARSDFAGEIERNMRRLPSALAEHGQAPAEGGV